MPDATRHGGARAKSKTNGHRPATRRPSRPVDFRWQRPASEVLTRVANLDSRAHMKRPQPRADLAENLLRTYDALWRRARVTHNALIDTTWRQLVTACGYPADTNTANGFTSVTNYLDLLAEAGLLAWGGAKNDRGQWKCLHVELLEPPPVQDVGRSSSAGQATLILCQARRRPEGRGQRDELRRRPWRRSGGRRDAQARHALSWSHESRESLPENASPYGGGRSSLDGQARTREGEAADAAPCRAPAPRDCGDENGERDRRAEARRQRRRPERVARWQAETRRQLRDGERMHPDELAAQRQADADPAAAYGRFAKFLSSIPKDG
jgi:hypothetical protein